MNEANDLKIIVVYGRQAFSTVAFRDKIAPEFPGHLIVAASSSQMLLANSTQNADLVIIIMAAAGDFSELDALYDFLSHGDRNVTTVIMGDAGLQLKPVLANAINLCGVFPDAATPDVVFAGLKHVLNGGKFFPQSQMAPVEAERTSHNVVPLRTASGQDMSQPGLAPPQHPIKLTEREEAVLQGLLQGLSNKAIARMLDTAENTVKIHVRAIFRKLGATNRTEAVLTALRVMK